MMATTTEDTRTSIDSAPCRPDAAPEVAVLCANVLSCIVPGLAIVFTSVVEAVSVKEEVGCVEDWVAVTVIN